MAQEAKKDMQSNGPALLIQHKMLKKQEEDKNCQSKKCYGSKVCGDKKCQATKYYKEIDKQCQTNVIMWPVKPQMDV